MSKRSLFAKVISLVVAICMISTMFVMTTSSVVAAEESYSGPVRVMEKLDRGLVAMTTASGIYMSWRFLGDDPDDVSFNIYRDGTKIATVSDSSNYLDAEGTATNVYTVSAVINGYESEQEGTLVPVLAKNGSNNGNYFDVQLQNPGNHASIKFRNARGDLYNATGKYYYMPIDREKINAMQTVVTDYEAGTITKAQYDAKVAEFKAYFDALGLDATGGTGPTLRELGYSENNRTPLRKNADGVLMYDNVSYTSNDLSVGDLDGDGQYELIVKWDPSNSRDSMISYGTSGPVFIDAYDIDAAGKATLMWRVNMGYNIRAGAHDTQIQVYDFDKDGKAEMILRTADGTTSGNVVDGTYVPTSFVGPKEAAYIEDYLKNNQPDLVTKYTTNIQCSASICWEDPVYNNNSGEYGEDGYITTGAYSGQLANQDWSKVYVYGPTQGAGDEYISLFDGETGAIIDSVPYVYAIKEEEWGICNYCRRSAGCSDKINGYDNLHANEEGYVKQAFWNSHDIGNNYMMFGDSTGNRSGRFLGGVACLDGTTPTALICRGYYARTTIAAYAVVDKKLVLDSTLDTARYENHDDYECRGNHNLSIGDVDGDHCDEIVYGSMTMKKNLTTGIIDPMFATKVCMTVNTPASNTPLDPKAGYNEDGTVKEGYRETFNNHGDAIHLLPMDASNTLVVCTPHEDMGNATDGFCASMDAHNAATGEVYAMAYRSSDQGRGAAGNVYPSQPDGIIISANANIYVKTGAKAPVSAGSNYLIYWTGSLVRQVSGGNSFTTFNGTRSVSIYNAGGSLNNGSKSNPSLQADLFGDWREELIVRSGNNLRIHTTNIPTQYKIRTLMHDPQYRMAIAWQNVCYNQPPHPGFFMGYEALGADDKVVGSAGINGNTNLVNQIPTSAPIIATAKRADIQVGAAPVSYDATLTTDKASYVVGDVITFTAVAPTAAKRVYITNEYGEGQVAISSSKDNGDGTTTWTFQVSLGTIGERTFGVAVNGIVSATTEFKLTAAPVAPVSLISVSAPEAATVNVPFTTTFVTSSSVTVVRLFNENGAGMAPIACTYVDNADGTRTWSYSISVGSIGYPRTFTAKVADASRNFIGDEIVKINIEAQRLPL